MNTPATKKMRKFDREFKLTALQHWETSGRARSYDPELVEGESDGGEAHGLDVVIESRRSAEGRGVFGADWRGMCDSRCRDRAGGWGFSREL